MTLMRQDKAMDRERPTWRQGWDRLYEAERERQMNEATEQFVGEVMEAVEAALGEPETIVITPYSDNGTYYTEITALAEGRELQYVKEHETALEDIYKEFYNEAGDLLDQFYDVTKENELYHGNPNNR